jgi:hypothetical protein
LGRAAGFGFAGGLLEKEQPPLVKRSFSERNMKPMKPSSESWPAESSRRKMWLVEERQ